MRYILFALIITCTAAVAKDEDDSSVKVKQVSDRSITVEISIDSEDPVIRELARQALDAVIDNAECGR